MWWLQAPQPLALFSWSNIVSDEGAKRMHAWKCQYLKMVIWRCIVLVCSMLLMFILEGNCVKSPKICPWFSWCVSILLILDTYFLQLNTHINKEVANIFSGTPPPSHCRQNNYMYVWFRHRRKEKKKNILGNEPMISFQKVSGTQVICKGIQILPYDRAKSQILYSAYKNAQLALFLHV